MNDNLKNRMKNPYFWTGLLGIILAAMGIDIEMLTSWNLLYQAFIDLISNPAMIFSVFLAVLGVFVDPTTKGLSDNK